MRLTTAGVEAASVGGDDAGCGTEYSEGQRWGRGDDAKGGDKVQCAEERRGVGRAKYVGRPGRGEGDGRKGRESMAHGGGAAVGGGGLLPQGRWGQRVLQEVSEGVSECDVVSPENGSCVYVCVFAFLSVDTCFRVLFPLNSAMWFVENSRLLFQERKHCSRGWKH